MQLSVRRKAIRSRCGLKDAVASWEDERILRRNPSDVGVTSGQKPSTNIIYIVLQTSEGLFYLSSQKQFISSNTKGRKRMLNFV